MKTYHSIKELFSIADENHCSPGEIACRVEAEEHDLSFEGPLSRKEELLSEMNIRLTRYDYYEDYKDAFGEAAAAGIKNDPAYQRAAASDITPLREFMG